MTRIMDLLQAVSDHYLDERQNLKQASKSVPSWAIVVDELPSHFRRAAYLGDRYRVKGSIGVMNFAEIPWICFFDRAITTSAQRGYYVALLFKADMSGFYLSLNQGWTDYIKRYGDATGRLKARENAAKAYRILRSTQDFSPGQINLHAEGRLGKGYERANICAKEYSFSNPVSDAVILDDLRAILGIYKELTGLIGSDILDIETPFDEEEYQEAAQSGHIIELGAGPVKLKKKVSTPGASKWPRDPNVAYLALMTADFKCEVDPSHETFTSLKTNRGFVEAHHLVPIERQDDFPNSLDVMENIISLCPTCHRKFHHAVPAEKTTLINDFYARRCKSLAARGIAIDLDSLLAAYGCR